MQTALELLRQQFAASTHLLHPDDDALSVLTEANKYAVSAVLKQPDSTEAHR
jgi:hypothetical protein